MRGEILLEQYRQDKKYQEEEAKAIADGIVEYLKNRGKKNGKKK